jgi:hypothetical protein
MLHAPCHQSFGVTHSASLRAYLFGFVEVCACGYQLLHHCTVPILTGDIKRCAALLLSDRANQVVRRAVAGVWAKRKTDETMAFSFLSLTICFMYIYHTTNCTVRHRSCTPTFTALFKFGRAAMSCCTTAPCPFKQARYSGDAPFYRQA